MAPTLPPPQEQGGRQPPDLSVADFQGFKKLFLELIGIHLADTKRQLVFSRLSRRLAPLGLGSFQDYLKLLRTGKDQAEIQRAVNLITSNETWFFREPEHFRLLTTEMLPSARSEPVRVWCGAASTGEEPYSLAMVLHETLGPNGWSLVATDINDEVLAVAKAGLYPMERARTIPEALLKQFCLRGTGDREGSMLIQESLRRCVHFRRMNLLAIDRDLVDLDIVFLRNVLIYFDAPERQKILCEVVRRLRVGGLLVLGHSESVVGLQLPPLQVLRPSVYRRTNPSAILRPGSSRCPSRS